MFTRMSDIDKMFGTMDLLRNKMDLIFGDFGRSFDDVPGLTFRSSGPRTNLYENGDTFEIRTEVPGIAKDDLNVKIQGIYENEDEIILQADMPGVVKEGLSVNIDNGTLSLSGVRKFETRGASNWEEFSDVEYVRSFSVPQTINVERVEAELKNGVLKLHLPKSEAAKPRQIEINAV